MAKKQRSLELVLSWRAIDQLHEIWRWNAEEFSITRADRYSAFLDSCLESMRSEYLKGRSVPNRPDLRYMQFLKGTKGHGHVAVYYFDEKAVYILNVFHTAQDWPTKLSD